MITKKLLFEDLIPYIQNFDILLNVYKTFEIIEIETNIISKDLELFFKCPVKTIKVIKNKLVISVFALTND